MTDNPQLLVYTAPEFAVQLHLSALAAVGYEVNSFNRMKELESWLNNSHRDGLLVIAHPIASEGLEYSAELLKLHPKLSIILVTNEIDQASLRQALELGLVDYLPTPVDQNAMLGSVENAWNRRKSWQQDYRFEQVLSGLVDGFILTDLDCRIILANQAARQIFAISDEKLERKPVDEVFYHPDLLDIFKPERTFPYRNEIAMEDGKVFIAEASLIPGIGIAVVMQDITHLKELDRVKTDFVNTISHDLRSPLTSIYGFIGLIDRVGPINRQQAEFIQHIQSSVQNITALINDLLDLSRVESGYDLQTVDVYMPDVIAQAIKALEYQISEKMQEVILSVPADVPIILGNPLHLQRMVGNLVENAIKFSPPAGRIDVRCSAEGEQLMLEVADHGPGIPIADQPHGFDKFFRGSNLSQTTMGTGLGLSIVKSIVEKHHGRIWLESSPGSTCFTVILPIK